MMINKILSLFKNIIVFCTIVISLSLKPSDRPPAAVHDPLFEQSLMPLHNPFSATLSAKHSALSPMLPLSPRSQPIDDVALAVAQFIVMKHYQENTEITSAETKIQQEKPKRTIPCHVCPLTFATRSVRFNHMRKKHPKALTHECQVCPLKFFNAKGLAAHCRIKHKEKIGQ